MASSPPRESAPPWTPSPPARAASWGRAPEIDPFGGRGIVGFHPGLLSGLALAGANRPLEPGQDDGILTALEVAELDLAGVELTVLSACETGLGETGRGQAAGGEGLLGLQRAFQVAGRGAVVATLWDVDDEATRALMERFYENLWQKKKMRLEALREAQLWMLRGGWRRELAQPHAVEEKLTGAKVKEAIRERRSVEPVPAECRRTSPTAWRPTTGRRSCSAAIGGRDEPLPGELGPHNQ